VDVTRLLSLTGTVVAVTDTGEPDEYGDPTTETTEATVAYWMTRRGGASNQAEKVGGDGDWQDGEFQLYLPPDTTITGRDRFRDCDGVTYEVAGPTFTHRNPRTTTAAYVSATLRRVD
jgi:hypothetical protein